MADIPYPLSADRVHQLLAWKRIVARAWLDSSFKADLLADPNGTLAAMGFPMHDGVSYCVAEDVPGQQPLVLPPAPDSLKVDGVAGNADADPGF